MIYTRRQRNKVRRLCKPRSRLGRVHCISEMALMELGIPSRAIRDSSHSDAIVWVDKRRIRRHLRHFGVR